MSSKKQKKQKLTPEEKEQKKLEKKQKVLRDQLDRELKFTEISEKRDKGFYYSICENQTRENLRDEINASYQRSTHEIDKKNHSIEVIKIHRDHASEQHLRLYAGHNKVIENLIDLYKIFQNASHELFETQRQYMIADFYADKIYREKIFFEKKKYFENYAHARKSLTKARSKICDEKYLSQYYDFHGILVLKNESLHKSKIEFNEKICRDVTKMFTQFTMNYPKHRLIEYEKALMMYEAMNAEIIENNKKLENLGNKILSLEKEISKENLNCSSVICEFKKGISQLCEIEKAKKLNMKAYENGIERKISVILIEARKLQKFFQKLIIIGRRIEKISILCKRYEKIDDLKFFKLNEGTGSSENDERENEFLFKLSKNNSSFDKNGLQCKEIISQSSLSFVITKSQLKDVEDLNSIKDIQNLSKIEKDHEGVHEFQNIFIKNLFQSSFSVYRENKDFNQLKNVQISRNGPRGVTFNLNTKPNSEIFNNEKSEIDRDLSINDSQKIPQNHENYSKFRENSIKSLKYDENFLDNLYECDLFVKISRVEIDCIKFKEYNQSLRSENKKMRELIQKCQRENDVQENLRMLNLNHSLAIGKIYQISHQISQICDKIKQKSIY